MSQKKKLGLVLVLSLLVVGIYLWDHYQRSKTSKEKEDTTALVPTQQNPSEVPAYDEKTVVVNSPSAPTALAQNGASTQGAGTLETPPVVRQEENRYAQDLQKTSGQGKEFSAQANHSLQIPSPSNSKPEEAFPTKLHHDQDKTSIQDTRSSREGTFPEAPTGGKKYVVQQGDRLYDISKKFYGSNRYWKKILEANQTVLKDPRQLRVGMSLTIPPIQETSEQESPTGKNHTPSGKPSHRAFLAQKQSVQGEKAGEQTFKKDGKTVLYTVKSGDTLWGIARKFYKNPSHASLLIKASNTELKSAKYLRIGMRLRLPAVSTDRETAYQMGSGTE